MTQEEIKVKQVYRLLAGIPEYIPGDRLVLDENVTANTEWDLYKVYTVVDFEIDEDQSKWLRVNESIYPYYYNAKRFKPYELI